MLVKGNVLIATGADRSPEAPALSGFLAQNNMAIDGGATGTDLTVGGNWDVRTVSRNASNLSNSRSP